MLVSDARLNVSFLLKSNLNYRGSWVVQLVDCRILGLSSGLDPSQGLEFKPCLGLHARCGAYLKTNHRDPWVAQRFGTCLWLMGAILETRDRIPRRAPGAWSRFRTRFQDPGS